jgi:tetratricopeptide (TPR) repeat protein
VSVRVVACTLAVIVVGIVASPALGDDKAAGGDKPGAGSGTAGADKPAAPAGDLVATVKTTKPRAEMSAFLVKDAEAAVTKRDWNRAIPLYEALVVARGPGSVEARKLANLYALAAQREDAIRTLQGFVGATEDPTAMKDAQNEIARLEKGSDPFAKPLKMAALDKSAAQSFKLGRAAFAAKRYGDALVYYSMGYQLAPDLPGFLRELGATYEKLGAHDRKIDFYIAYLRRRPFGKNADEVRKDLAGEKRVLGTLTISSSLPCDEVWVAGQPLPGKLPKKEVAFAPGKYKALCINYKYELGFFEYATVTAGQPAQLAFNWGVVVNQLEKPYGRIAIENPNKPGEMLDLGIDQPEIGVVVPADGHAMRMLLKDDSGTKSPVERFVKIAPGQRVVVKW